MELARRDRITVLCWTYRAADCQGQYGVWTAQVSVWSETICQGNITTDKWLGLSDGCTGLRIAPTNRTELQAVTIGVQMICNHKAKLQEFFCFYSAT